MSSAYSVADQNLLHILLKTIVEQNKAEDIKLWQSDYWYNVFGNKAYNLLYNKNDGSLGASDIASGHEKELRGVILSIMSDRYMNKSLMNKTNLELKIKKGDLWPFLVYTTTYNNGITTLWEYEDYKVDKNGKKQKKKTTWDDLIWGAYYYMVYYEYKYDYEGDIELDEDVIYNSTKVEMFVQEYQALTGKAFVELTGAELDDFYQKIRNIRRIYKKSDENGALFGEEEDYSINSDVTYTQAMNNIKSKMEQSPFNKIFGDSLSSEHIARTYLMAKNIAENHRLTNQNAQYDIGSNILQRTPGGYDNTILLTDLQKITLERGEDKKFSKDADKDGILDGNEMGTYEQVDITDFVKHMLKAESGLTDVSALMTNYKNRIIAANNDKTKINLVESQKDIDVVREGNEDKIKVFLMSYKSNPILKDTDFDGIDDGYGEDDEAHKNVYRDEKPLDNSIKGNIKSSNRHIYENVSFASHMDYRYFFMDEYNYYDELSTMSLLLSNAMNNSGEVLSNIDYMMPHIGYDNYVRRNAYGDVGGANVLGIDIGGVNYNVEYVTGLKEVKYSKDNSANNYISKLIVPIIIKTPNEINLSKSYSEIGEPNWTEKCDTGKERHNVKSYEVYAELIKDDLHRYCLETTGININAKNIVFWITGHKEAGAIANVLASKYIDDGHKVYAYTFGSPMTLYNNPDEKGYTRTGYSMRYDSIFNVVNEDDPNSYLMPQKLGFSRYGLTCFGNVRNKISGYLGNKGSVEELVKAINNLYSGKENYTRTETYEAETGLKDFIVDVMKAVFLYRNNFDESVFNTLLTKYKKDSKLMSVINTLKYNRMSYYDASGTDVYYYIAKDMQNADITNVVNLHDEKEHILRVATGSNSIYLASIEDMSKWYVDNVATYQRKLQTETIASLDNYNTKLNYIIEYRLKNYAKVERKYKVATNNQENSQNKNIYPKATTSILKATENAVNNYKTNYSQITFGGNLAYYPCDDINTGTDTYKKAGDDCVRFAFACFKKMDSNFISNLEQYSGLSWANINSTRLAGKDKDTNDKIATAMTKLGFEIYDMDGDDKPKDYNKDNIDDYEIKSLPSNFKLQVGDFVACDGHVHFCLEDDNDSRSNTDKDNFGWGSVCREYPKHYKFKVESAGNNKYHIVSSGHVYTRVYRYTK